MTITLSNSGQVEGAPEEMQIVLTDAQNQALVTWLFDTGGQIIAPGQSTKLYTRLELSRQRVLPISARSRALTLSAQSGLLFKSDCQFSLALRCAIAAACLASRAPLASSGGCVGL